MGTVLCDRNDPTRLTGMEIKDEFGSLVNFVVSYGLKPYDLEDLKEALSISRSLKESGSDQDDDDDEDDDDDDDDEDDNDDDDHDDDEDEEESDDDDEDEESDDDDEDEESD